MAHPGGEGSEKLQDQGPVKLADQGHRDVHRWELLGLDGHEGQEHFKVLHIRGVERHQCAHHRHAPAWH